MCAVFSSSIPSPVRPTLLRQLDTGITCAQIWVLAVHTKGSQAQTSLHKSWLGGTEQLFLAMPRQIIEPRVFGFEFWLSNHWSNAPPLPVRGRLDVYHHVRWECLRCSCAADSAPWRWNPAGQMSMVGEVLFVMLGLVWKHNRKDYHFYAAPFTILYECWQPKISGKMDYDWRHVTNISKLQFQSLKCYYLFVCFCVCFHQHYWCDQTVHTHKKAWRHCTYLKKTTPIDDVQKKAREQTAAVIAS